ncbi:MAG: hypothetical protein AAF467_21785 [Actinomycetota bacterium]
MTDHDLYDADAIDDDEDFDDFDEFERPNPYAVPEVEALLEEAIEMLAEARPLPMSTTVKVARDDLLHVLEQAQERLPEEVRAARWLLKEREDFIAKARLEHQALIDEGRAQVSRMVERQQVVKEAESRARQILDEAKAEANTMKREAEEYCDRKLARFEAVLLKTTETVQRGRERLVGMTDVAGARPNEWGDDDWDDQPFDDDGQDHDELD